MLIKALCPTEGQGFMFLRDFDKEAAAKLSKRYKKMQEAKRKANSQNKDVTSAKFGSVLGRALYAQVVRANW